MALLVVLLLFLTFENAMSGQAIWGTRDGSVVVKGFSAILVNLGILSIVLSFGSYLAYLRNRRELLHKLYNIFGVLSAVLVLVGFLTSAT
ncbi:hypothetical protein J7384_18595 [Endozoicomonas sp. G2_1]|uniref:hypothetical protein n=1 Tax=Endozoicomonas sp. G2_1 TaxID=2821091 RepID=UPI001ADBEECE|nr:hypothetical protein [Endozoicomonas sp. G2_1]MBO9492378.1 hypothetical protein [Endozoicomonas sp. G2_1]